MISWIPNGLQVEPDELVLSDQDLQMGRLGERRESHSSEKFTRESSTEAPPERRKRRKKKSATIGKRLSLACHRFGAGRRSRQAERVDWCVQISITTERIWWTKTQPIRPQMERKCPRKHGRKGKQTMWSGHGRSRRGRVFNVQLLNLQKVKGEGVTACWWFGHWRRWRHHGHASFDAAAPGTGPVSGSEPAVGEGLCGEEQWVGRENTPHTDGGSVLMWFLACRAFPAHGLLGLEEDQRPDGQHGWAPARAAAALDHQGCFCQSARRLQVGQVTPRLLPGRRPEGPDEHLFPAALGCWGCTATASWRASPCGTWWWCTCCRASTSPLWATCCGSTTAWPTPPSVCSTCCWPSAPWPPSTGKRDAGTGLGRLPAPVTLSCCLLRVNLAQASVALRELITLDAVALASFCESTSGFHTCFYTWSVSEPRPQMGCFSSVFLSADSQPEPADDQRSD